MGYDLHFENGRHEWHSIWVVETTVLLIAYAEGKIKRQELLDTLSIMAMSKSEVEGASEEEPSDVSESKNTATDKKQADFLIEIVSFDKDEVDDLSDVVFSDRKNDKVDKVYGAKVIPRNEAAKADIPKFKETAAKVMLPFIAWRERMDDHKALLNMPQLNALFDNDGQTLTSSNCAQMLYALTKIDKKLLQEVDEISPMGAVGRLFSHFAYSAGSGFSITVR